MRKDFQEVERSKIKKSKKMMRKDFQESLLEFFFESEIREWAEMGEWAKASIKKQNFSTESHRIIISFIFFIFQSIQQETDFLNFDL